MVKKNKKQKKKIIHKENWNLFSKVDWKLFVVCLFVVYTVGFIGGTFTDVGDWYNSVRPSITPPNIVFPIVWNILFFMIGIAFYLSFKNSSPEYRQKMGILYVINFVLNILWSFFYFTAKSPVSSLIVIVLLICSICALIVVNWKKSRNSSYLLIPYLLWVSFATILNIMTISNLYK